MLPEPTKVFNTSYQMDPFTTIEQGPEPVAFIKAMDKPGPVTGPKRGFTPGFFRLEPKGHWEN